MTTQSCVPGILVTILILLTACAGPPPVQEIRVYDAAFERTRSAGEAVLDEAASAVAVKEQTERERHGESEGLYPQSFDPESVSLDPEAAVPDVIRVRYLALRTIADYNDALLALAEGRTLEQVQGQVAALGQTVEALLPLIGIAGGPLPGLALGGLQSAIAAAETARERAAVEHAILAAHADVDGIIAALIADTPDLYELLRTRRELELDAIDREMGDTWRSMTRLASAHRAATAPSEIKEIVETEQRARRAFASATPSSQIAGLPDLTLAPASQGGAPLDAATIRELDSGAARLEAAAARYMEGVQAIRLAHEAMKQYVLLLRRARQAMHDLKSAVAAPPGANVVLARIVDSGIELRHQADQVQRIVGALRAR